MMLNELRWRRRSGEENEEGRRRRKKKSVSKAITLWFFPTERMFIKPEPGIII